MSTRASSRRMLPYFTEHYGNAASTQPQLRLGGGGRRRIRPANQVANLIGATPKEIIWTSGATEGEQPRHQGRGRDVRPAGQKGKHIITCRHEHKAVLDPCKRLHEAKASRSPTSSPTRTACISTCRAGRSSNPRRHHPRHRHVGQQRDRHRQRNPRDRQRSAARQRRRSSTTTRRSGSARCPPTSRPMNIDLLALSLRTRCTGPRASGLSTSDAASPASGSSHQLIDGGGHERGMRSRHPQRHRHRRPGRRLRNLRTRWSKERELASKACDRSRMDELCFAKLDTPSINGHKPTRRLPTPDQHLLRLRRGRVADDGHQGHRMSAPARPAPPPASSPAMS
jgi:hypothetical protein